MNCCHECGNQWDVVRSQKRQCAPHPMENGTNFMETIRILVRAAMDNRTIQPLAQFFCGSPLLRSQWVKSGPQES